MNRSMVFVRSGRRHIATLFFLVICWPIASAEEVSIQASFEPDSGNPQRNKFINDTPSSGYCASNPSECRDNGDVQSAGADPVRLQWANSGQP